MTIKKILPVVLMLSLAMTLTACERKAKSAVVSPADSKTEPVKNSAPVISPKDWKAALDSTYQKRSVEHGNNGVERFLACFEPNPDPTNVAID